MTYQQFNENYELRELLGRNKDLKKMELNQQFEK